MYVRQLASLLIAVNLLGGCATAQSISGPMSSSWTSSNPVCAYSTFNVDGCAQANQASFFKDASYYTDGSALQNGQSWTNSHPWSWNAPGWDYPVGHYTPDAQLKDPSTATLPSGCTYNATGHNGGPWVTCSNVAGLTFQGWYMGHTATHNCVFLNISGNVSGAILVTNNHFINNDPGNVNTGCNFTGNSSWMAGGVNTNTVATSLTVTYNTFEGNALNNTAYLSTQFNSNCTPCTTDFEYNYSSGASGRIFSSFSANTTVAHNYAADMNITGNTVSWSGFISGTTLTINNPGPVFNGSSQPANITIGSQICPSTNPCSVSASTHITGYGTGTGGAGTYTVDVSQTSGSSGSPITMFSTSGLHGEWGIFGTGTGLTTAAPTFKYNVMVYTHNSGPSSALLFCSTGSTINVTFSCDAENNIVVPNLTWANVTPVGGGIVFIEDNFVATLTIQNNFLDLTGMTNAYCEANVGGTAQSMTGSLTGGVLTVNTLNGTVTVGVDGAGFQAQLTGGGVTPGTNLLSFGTGTGGTGTYNVSGSQTIGSFTAMKTIPSPISGPYTNTGNLDLVTGHSINSMGVLKGSAGCT